MKREKLMNNLDDNLKDPFVKIPTLTSDNKPWVQRCYVCLESINFIKDPRASWMSVGEYVRHKKCLPPPAR